jgi:DNA-binding beta-propeller fold protein YncE
MTRLLAATWVALALAGLASAQGTAAQGTSSQARAVPRPLVPFDNQVGRYLNFEVGHVQPMALSADRSLLYVVNTHGWRLAALDASTRQVAWEAPIGLGAASVVARPGTTELWVVDRVQSSISIVDTTLQAIVRTIRVGAEPHHVVFSPAGDRAWVSCAAARRVETISTASYAVVGHVRIPALEPRAMAWAADRLWVSSFQSGNNTTGRGVSSADADNIVEVRRVAAPATPLPDRDLFAIVPGPTPGAESLDLASTRTGLGTTLFNAHVRPGTSELWIPCTDALNADFLGEGTFVGGQAVRNLVKIVDLAGSSPTRTIDLDALAPSADVRCAQPTGLAFDSASGRVYVAGYGSDLIAVLRLAQDGSVAWEGSLRQPAKQSYPRGSGPRALLFDAVDQTLWVYCKNDSAVSKIDTAALPSAVFHLDANPPVAYGMGARSTEESLGRHLFTDARLSDSKTTSCASCHVDGHTDGLLWDLSEYLTPEGTPAGGATLALDHKGPLVTQSTRRMEESAPYHWRGEKRHINEFNASFMSLLDRKVNGQPAHIAGDFQYLRHYINRLAIPANPLQQADRGFTADQLEGARLFAGRPLDASGQTCASCHMLPLGSSGEVVASAAEGPLRSADVPSLRGVADKEQPSFYVGSSFGHRPESGTGLLHGGYAARLQDSYSRGPFTTSTHSFDLSPAEADRIADFLRAFDTGLAPATTWQATMRPENVDAVLANEFAFLRAQATAGHCELVAYRSVQTPSMPRTGLYDPATGQFRMSAAGVWLTPEALAAEARAGQPVTLLGVPLGMGPTMGVDRDFDHLYDADELALGTDPEDVDTDGDKLPDGWELPRGTDPLVFDQVSPDTTAPSLVGPARLVYRTTNTLKFEFDVDELSRCHVSVNGGSAIQRIPLDHYVDTRHWVVLGNLEPDTDYTIGLELRDPEGNIRLDTSTVFRTAAPRVPDALHVESITLGTTTGSTPLLHASVSLRRGSVRAVPGTMVVGAVYRRIGTSLPTTVIGATSTMTDASGNANFTVALPNTQVGSGTTWFVVREVRPPTGTQPWIKALDAEFHKSIVW